MDANKPYEAELLHFQNGHLTMLDYISMDGIRGSFTIDRILYN